MAVLQTEWDTRNNLEAEDAAMHASNTPSESDAVVGVDPDSPGITDGQVLALIKSAYSQGTTYQQSILQPRWNASYLSFNNKHSGESKYSTARWRGRTRLFRPKTRSATRKKSAEAAAALFSTSDVVLVSGTNPSDPKDTASASIVQELLNFRLDRSNENAGIPWFMISMGAHLTAQQTAVCISKQYWEYKTEEDGVEDVPLVINGVQIGMQSKPKIKIVRDRPRCRLFPPEDVVRDPGAAWEDQAQDSSFLILKHPMAKAEAREFLAAEQRGSALKFITVDDASLTSVTGADQGDAGTSANTRRAREQSGNDRLKDNAVNPEFQTVWLHENFLRIKGRDFTFWTLGTSKLVSNVVPTAKAYPEQGGARPVTIGVSTIEPFKIDPMSPIESWQPLQQEINDVVNLRLDTMKQTISPLTLVRRGRSVDIKAIQNRSPDSVAYVQDPSDVTFDRPGEVGQASYLEMEKLNADFDEQAGHFSIGSVQTNRQLGNTVGGMGLVNNSANAMGEFDLRVWIETWVEPCLRQLVKLEQFFESDENVIAIAAGKAKLFQRFGVDAVTDEMLTSQVGIVVNVGLGSADPMLALSKFEKAAQIAGGILGPSIQQSLNREAVIDEVFGKAGIKDASERFFQPGIDQDPQLQQAQKVVQELQGALQQAQGALSDKQAERDSKEKIATITAQSRQAPLDPNAQQKAQHDLIDAQKQADHDRAMQINEAANKASLAALQAQHAHEQQLSKDAMAQKDTAYKMEQLAIQKQEAYYKYLTAIDVAKINASGDLNQTELEAHIEGILGWQDHQPQMRANLLAAKVPAAQEQAPMQDGEPAPAAAAPVGKRKVQPHDMMMHGLAAMTGKIGEIGNQIIQTQKDIAAAPRDVIRNPDGTARGIQLKLS